MDEVSGCALSAVRALDDPHATTLEPDPTLLHDADCLSTRYRDGRGPGAGESTGNRSAA